MKLSSINSHSSSWSLAFQATIACILGFGINSLAAPFDSEGIAVFGVGVAVYASLRFPPVFAIPLALVISIPLWLNHVSIVGKESLTLLPIVISYFGYN